MATIPLPGVTVFGSVFIRNFLKCPDILFSDNDITQPTSMGTSTVVSSTTLSYYEVGVLAFTTAGSYANATNIAYQRNGRAIHIFMPRITNTATAATLTSPAGALPAYLRPQTTMNQIYIATVNSANVAAVMTISTAGTITWTASITGGNYTNAQEGGVLAQTITYLLH